MLRLFYIIWILPCFAFAQPAKIVSGDSIVSYAKQFLGTGYKYAFCEPEKGFDCSGFVYYVYTHFGIKVPRSSMDYEKIGKKIPIDSCRKGDVIIFTGTDPKKKRAGHVGIIISDKGQDVEFIHSSSGNKNQGVILTNYSASTAYKKRFIKVVRLSGVR
ncbi:MAG: NlpC/P60 family protein [Bacteroidetes bacterium]|jgi:cell wall-associated NlpC family hydrolase|nr:NlpC/P60 family protein [Bacteroidota bacterium]